MQTSRNVVLRSRPIGTPQPTDFDLVEKPVARAGDDQMLVAVTLCSLDPAMRRWFDADSYGASVAIGGDIPCTLVGRVIESQCEEFSEGDLVTGRGTVSSHCLLNKDGYTRRIDSSDSLPMSAHLSVLGTSGLTAYNGLLKVGRPQPGQTVLVSAAAGSVGSLVGQIAKIQGCRAVGIAGGPAKCESLLQTYGFDGAIDYKGKDADLLASEVRRACPGGVDVYFDNVGGMCLEAALTALNNKARVVLCGMISEYNRDAPAPGPRNLWQLVARTATMTGFLNREYLSDCANELQQMRHLIDAGRLTWKVHEEQGLDTFYSAFMRLFDGSHEGRMILQVAAAA